MSYLGKIIGSNIARLRQEKDLTLQELAGDLSMSYQNLCKLIKGEQYPKEETVEKICKYFNITPCQLFSTEKLTLEEPELQNYSDREILEILIKTLKNLESNKLKAVCKIVTVFLEQHS